MITLPDFTKSWDYENAFYLSCDASRLTKVLAHYELFKRTLHLPGAVVEFGVFKGASLARFAMLREVLSTTHSKKIIGFDIFGAFPETSFAEDRPFRQRFVESAGEQSISVDQMWDVLRHKGVNQNVELIAGDVCKTLPSYLAEHPEMRASLVNLDTDVYEPAVTVLEQLWPRLVPGGVMILDDYGVFPGESKAVDEFFGGSIEIHKFPFSMTPAYVIKEPA